MTKFEVPKMVKSPDFTRCDNDAHRIAAEFGISPSRFLELDKQIVKAVNNMNENFEGGKEQYSKAKILEDATETCGNCNEIAVVALLVGAYTQEMQHEERSPHHELLELLRSMSGPKV